MWLRHVAASCISLAAAFLQKSPARSFRFIFDLDRRRNTYKFCLDEKSKKHKTIKTLQSVLFFLIHNNVNVLFLHSITLSFRSLLISAESPLRSTSR